jgi:type I restriction enzyme S subunit
MSKWPVSSLHGKLHVKHGYPFKSEYFSDTGHYIVLTPGNFFEEGGFKRQAGKEKYYLGEIPKEYLHSKGDLIVAMTEQAAGLLGSCAFVPDGGVYLHNQRLGLITCDPEQLTLAFVFYLFQTKSVREQIRLTSTGSKVKHTSPERIYAVTAPLPKAEEQRKIAAVLSALDAKIDCNNRINAELEAMAKALYDYWFVQFDFPDVNGKPYKSSGGKMVYSAALKREIPARWKVVRLNELFQSRTDSITASNVNNGVPYTPIDVLPMKRMSFGVSRPSSEANTSLIQYKENDILIGAMRVYFHRVCIAPFDGITRTTIIVLRPNKPNHLPYLYQLCNEDRTINFASKISVGTQQPYVNWEGALENHEIWYPEDDALIEKYSSMTQTFAKDVIRRERENAELAQLRDWLLPLLMNGQVKVA